MYNLKVSKEQAEVIVEALDIHSRLLCGQIDELKHLFRRKIFEGEIDATKLRATLIPMKLVIFPDLHPNVSYGICSPEAPDRAKTGYDILQVIRSRLAWDEHQPGDLVGVAHCDPLRTSNEKLPTIDKE